MKINSNQRLKKYNQLQIARNTKINEINISICLVFNDYLKYYYIDRNECGEVEHWNTY